METLFFFFFSRGYTDTIEDQFGDCDKTSNLNCKHILKQAEITRYSNGILCVIALLHLCSLTHTERHNCTFAHCS